VSNDKTIKLWNAQTRKIRVTLKGHGDIIGAVAFSPDGKRIATCSRDATARIWDAESGRNILTFNHTDHVSDITFNAKIKQPSILVTSSFDGRVRLFTLDIDDLVHLARNLINRALTPEECQRYLHSKNCPKNAKAIKLMVEGKNFARKNEKTKAIESYHKAAALDNSLKINPLKEFEKWAAFTSEEPTVKVIAKKKQPPKKEWTSKKELPKEAIDRLDMDKLSESETSKSFIPNTQVPQQ
jgi:WD40 repeat protein